ncbi:ETX/MTX2 family pore-forming toxin [Trinickia caryophylli]|uniref:D-mannose binding lectin n=1 Tax=Trinickia caryophylli TaxID=28094 RepID=A0A1X7FJQ7_TRICW|nr:ETX/MTX2 family pore-forming toxin [Trinickia caryophylli]PMS13219.1 aerolysin family beta-barrel pore-forming toxin [Trinickia caryophylli]TRX19253.1 aerolysin family beta-barrel pore-forming toxin [Trinickia caryophylli]WQE13445.1 ETX/MTX2 family pore-forming toxin [Trinickia caryophylli]SMF52716.1 D-mannose binding lectin [Trinickia caryophylli]GLU34031.1 hypothetical protein Busp01_38730 [Trinickia caryophylli]
MNQAESVVVGGGEKRSVLPMNQSLRIGESLQSKNGLFCAGVQPDGNLCVYRTDLDKGGVYLWGTQAVGSGGKFFAIVQSDGNLCVYHGTDASTRGNWLWGSQATAGGGKFFLILQDDGNLCVYKGSGPDEQGDLVWHAGRTDAVKEVTEIISLNYDLDRAEVTTEGISDLYKETVQNNTGQTQSSTLTGSVSASETSGWSDSFGFKIGLKTSFKTGVPCIADGKVEMSVELSNTYTWNGSNTNTKSWGFSTPIQVPANTALSAIISACRSTIVVPYTQIAILEFYSGAKTKVRIEGKYKGSHCHDLTVSFRTGSLSGGAGMLKSATQTSTRPLGITSQAYA